MVLGLLPITSGKFTFQGKDVTNPKGTTGRRTGGTCRRCSRTRSRSFNQFFTVKDAARPVDAAAEREVGKDRLEEALGHVGMDLSVLDRYPHQMSGGQRQRVMIARALMLQPTLLVADEATAMLDASLRVNILNVLTDLRDELDMTVLFITHDIGQACYLADQVLVMEHGVMVEQGPPRPGDLPPEHDYTKKLWPTCRSCTRRSSSTSAITRPAAIHLA